MNIGPIRSKFKILLLLGMLCVASPSSDVLRPSVDAREIAEDDQIQKLIQELDHDRFLVRENAMIRLSSIGGDSVKPLVEAIPHGSLEMKSRGVNILRHLSLLEDQQIAEAAETGLRELAGNAQTSLSSRVKLAIFFLNKVKQSQAVQDLEQRGASITRRTETIEGRRVFVPISLELDDKWSGNNADLTKLGRLVDLLEMDLTGESVSDETVRQLIKVPQLASLRINRASISDNAIEHVKIIKNLRFLEICFCEISDKSITQIGQLRTLAELNLFGTKISDQGIEAIRNDLPHVDIQYKKGGFLGVACETHGSNCIVVRIVSDSPAEKARFQLHDVVAEFDGKAVESADQLVEIGSNYFPGEKIKVKLIRGQKVLIQTVTMGEWP